MGGILEDPTVWGMPRTGEVCPFFVFEAEMQIEDYKLKIEN
jgi:hypothetical protein